MRNKLAKGLFILGLVIVSTVLIGKLYKSSIEKKTLEEFKEKFNYSEEEKKKTLEEIKNGDGIALIDIEKIGVHTVIAEGSTLSGMVLVGKAGLSASENRRGKTVYCGGHNHLYR